MNIPVDVARAQGHHGIKGAVHGSKGGRPRLELTDAERVGELVAVPVSSFRVDLDALPWLRALKRF